MSSILLPNFYHFWWFSKDETITGAMELRYIIINHQKLSKIEEKYTCIHPIYCQNQISETITTGNLRSWLYGLHCVLLGCYVFPRFTFCQSLRRKKKTYPIIHCSPKILGMVSRFVKSMCRPRLFFNSVFCRIHHQIALYNVL